MRRWIAGLLITVLTMTSTAPLARAQSTPLIGGGLVALPTQTAGPNLVQNPGFETAGPAGWPASGGWSLDQLTKHGGSFSYRRDSGGTMQQLFSLKAGVYKASAWVKTQSLGSGSSSGARLTLDFRPGGFGSWTPSEVVSGTTDWKLVEIGPIVVDQDRTAGLQLEMYNGPGGTAWFDDVTLTQIQANGVEVFLLYPNFRGMLFDDGPSTMKFDVKTSPPGGDFGRYGVVGTLEDEATGAAVATQSYAGAAQFVAELEGAGMQPGRAYLASFSLVDKANGNATVATYPPYRVSKVAASVRNGMKVAFDARNNVLIKGQPRFILGVYDSGMGYSTDPNFWETNLWSPTGERRMGGMKINMYLNYWYGETPANAIKALMDNLQQHGVTYLQTGNCFDKYPAGPQFFINSSDAYVQEIGAHDGLAGYYTIDECIPSLVPGAFTQYDRLRRLDPGSITFMANFGGSNLGLWRDAVDIVSTDPYPLYSSEPAGGYNHKQVADWTANTRNVVKDARPIMTVLQFFKFTSLGRWPTLAEMRSHAYMAIVEGAKGLWWWSLGDNALKAVCSGWCAEKTAHMNDLKAVVNELADLEPALLADDAPTALTANSNTAIKTKVKVVGGKGYVFAYNSTNGSQTATFTWNTAPGTVSVNAENRNLGASGNNFTDTFGPYAAHVYVIANGGTGGTPPPPPPPAPNPTVAFTAPAPDATVSGTTTVTLAGSGGSGSGYTYSLQVDGTAISGTGPSYSWNTAGAANGAHTLTATVTDSAGKTGTATLSVTVSNTTPPPPSNPTVTFNAPTNGATVTGTTTVTLAASGGSGTGYTYSLKVDGTAISGTGSSYSWNTTTVANGTRTLTATATDSAGGTGTASITVTVSNTTTPPPPPTGTLKVFVTQPANNATVSGTPWAVMWLEGAVAGNKTYTLTLGGKPMGSQTTSSNGPVSMPYDTKMVVDGTQPLTATVKDASNNTGAKSVDVNVKNGITTPPGPAPLTASFTSPAAGATVSGTTTVGMSVSGSTAVSRTFRLAVDGTVVSTQTVSGTTASYAWNTAGVANGPHTLTLTASDSAGGSATATLAVTVSNVVTPPPAPALTAAFTSPAAGATVSGTTTVGMSSTGGATTSASRTYRLSVDGTVVSTQTVSGGSASYAWNTAGVANGAHTLSLTVTDTAGGSATATRSVTVSNTTTPPPPTGTLKVYVTQPAANATVRGTQWVVVWLDNAAAGNKTYTLSANGKVVWTQTTSARPASMPWNTTTTANGTATLTVDVKDSAGNTGRGTVNVRVAN